MKVLQAFSTSVGSKILIALSGLALFGFLVFHLAGNLLVFFGPERYNEHAHALISNPLIIPAELGLLAIFLLHVYKATVNYTSNREARPVKYAKKTWAHGASRKSLASTSMIVSGLLILAFVILHIQTFKYGQQYQAAGAPEMRDLYRLLVEVFHRPGSVAFYVLCMAIVGLHLRHGVSSACQSLGVIPGSWTATFLRLGFGLAILTAIGFLVIPLYVYFFL